MEMHWYIRIKTLVQRRSPVLYIIIMMIIGVTQTANSFIALTRTGHWSLYHVWYPIKGASKVPQQL